MRPGRCSVQARPFEGNIALAGRSSEKGRELCLPRMGHSQWEPFRSKPDTGRSWQSASASARRNGTTARAFRLPGAPICKTCTVRGQVSHYSSLASSVHTVRVVCNLITDMPLCVHPHLPAPSSLTSPAIFQSDLPCRHGSSKHQRQDGLQP